MLLTGRAALCQESRASRLAGTLVGSNVPLFGSVDPWDVAGVEFAWVCLSAKWAEPSARMCGFRGSVRCHGVSLSLLPLDFVHTALAFWGFMDESGLL